MSVIIVEHAKLSLVLHVIREYSFVGLPENILVFQLYKDFLLQHREDTVELLFICFESLRYTSRIIRASFLISRYVS